MLLTRGKSTGGGSALPSGYLAAEFLESDGRTAVIDSKIVPNWETGLHVKMQTLTTGTAYYLGTQNNIGLPSLWVCDINGILRIKYNQDIFNVNSIHETVFEVKINWLNSKKAETELDSKSLTQTGESPWSYHVSFFRATYQRNTTYDNGKQARFYCIKMSQGAEIMRDMTPCISPEGAGCMYDRVTKQPFYNAGSGSFIVGMTCKQALKLAELPSTGGTLTVSLPTGYDEDAGVVAALETARANGWTLTVQTYEAEGVMTTDLFDIWVRKTQDENGSYIDSDGTRWQVDWCNCMYTPDGSTERDHGYESHPSVEEACSVWGLTPYIDPNLEEEI